MAIVKMSKFNLFSFDDQRESLLEKFQKFNYVHFNDLSKENEKYDDLDTISSEKDVYEIDEKIAKIKYSLDILEAYEEKASGLEALRQVQKTYTLDELRAFGRSFNFDKEYDFLKRLDEKRISYAQEIQNLKGRISDLKPWSNLGLSVGEIKSFKNVDVFLGSISSRFAEDFISEIKELDLIELVELSSSSNYYYLAIISDISKRDELDEIFRKFAFTSSDIKTDRLVSEEIKELESKIKDLEKNVDSIENQLKSKKDLIEDLRLIYEFYQNERQRVASKDAFLKTRSLDVIEGYVPTNRAKDFEKLIRDVVGDDYYLTIEPASRDDEKVPIILKNGPFAGAFENLTKMYSLPRYNEVDPTPLFAPFYWIFAGIMVGDAGYGLLVFIATLIGLVAFRLKPAQRGMVKFLNYLSISTILWGLVFGSFFGFSLPFKLLDPATQYVEMIALSLGLGGVHLFFGLAIKAYIAIRDGHPQDAIFDVLFWYMAVLGVIVWIAFMALKPNESIANIGKWSFILGMIGIVLTGGRTEPSIAGKIGWGIYSAYGITSYIGDFVSYLRLMALALAGAFIAVAVNLIVKMLFGAGIVGIIGGIIIFVIFQLFNAFLSYLSAYVHTARLTYVEMFNKFYEGGGVPFRNMIADSKYYNIKED
ncbi:V-type ATP synthase subunit I [Peptoniphilus sp. GNH]|nr:V-type ATP synthase subunit I [Peptoniphilus sp. GNH]